MDGRLTGAARYVLDGAIADVLLVAARDGDALGLFEVDPVAARREHTPSMDLTRRLARVGLSGATGRRIGSGGFPAERVRDLALVALSAEQVGAARRCLELTVEYTRARVQFGRPIGSFQALKHRMADLHGGIAITWEHDAQLYLKRAHGSAQLFGQPGAHLARLASRDLQPHL